MIRFTLLLAVLVLGGHIGAAVYEMVVITPLWAGNPPQSVRNFNPVADFAIEPLSYKRPAIIVLAVTAFGLLSVGSRRGAGRAWSLLAGTVALALVVATSLHAFPLLQRTIMEKGARLTDAQILEQVHAWLLWSRMRIAALVLAWAAAVAALLQHHRRPDRFFSYDLRWK